MTPGVHPDITAREYFAECCPAPALTNSTVKTLIYRTAAEAAYEHPALNPGSPEAASSAAKRFGDVAHQLALGKGRGYAIGDYDAWRSNDAKQFKADAEAAGLTPIVRAKFEEAQTVAAIMSARIETTLATLNDGEVPEYLTECVFIWQEEGPFGPIWCRAMADVWCPSLGVIMDPKFSTRLGNGVFEGHAVGMGWDLQAAWYLRGMSTIYPERAGKLRFVNLVISPNAPHVFRALEADEATRMSCEVMFPAAISVFGTCLKTSHWPGYSPKIEPWTARNYTLSERMMKAAMEEESAA